jgi:hypothetical protein
MTDNPLTPVTMTRSEFARHINAKPGYVTQLIAAGRIVLNEDDRIVVVDSLERINATRNPDRAAVAAHHASNRGSPLLHLTPPENFAENAIQETRIDKAGELYQQSKALDAKYRALASKRDYELSIGKLMLADDVIRVCAEAATICRTRLETIPDLLAPHIAAETDETRCKALMRDQIEHILETLTHHFKKLEKNTA